MVYGFIVKKYSLRKGVPCEVLLQCGGHYTSLVEAYEDGCAAKDSIQKFYASEHWFLKVIVTCYE